ncbi:MAG: hypothetical protein WEA80_07755 [Gemmatimonadaceae bacterium]
MTDRTGRGGFALVLAILAVVVAGALIVATHVAVTLEHRMAASRIARQRAFAMSEYALWGAVAAWDASSPGLPEGSATVKIIRAGGDSAILTTTRLNEQMYWLVAEATVGEARRRTGVNVLALTDSTGTHVRAVRRSWVELH